MIPEYQIEVWTGMVSAMIHQEMDEHWQFQKSGLEVVPSERKSFQWWFSISTPWFDGVHMFNHQTEEPVINFDAIREEINEWIKDVRKTNPDYVEPEKPHLGDWLLKLKTPEWWAYNLLATKFSTSDTTLDMYNWLKEELRKPEKLEEKMKVFCDMPAEEAAEVILLLHKTKKMDKPLKQHVEELIDKALRGNDLCD